MKNGKKSVSDMRRRAEDRLSEKKKHIAIPHTQSDMQRLIHELEVHQIELEMQNDELRHSRAELDMSLERYANLYDFAPVGYFTLAHSGNIQQVNLTGSRLLGKERTAILFQPFEQFISPSSRSAFKTFLEDTLRSQPKASCEVKLQSVQSETCYVHIEGRVSENGQECHIAVFDITVRRHLEQELRLLNENLTKTLKERTQEIIENEERFSVVFKSNPMAMCLVSVADQVFVDVNESWKTLLGYSRKEVIGQSVAGFNMLENPDMAAILIELKRRSGVLTREALLKTKSTDEKTVLVSIQMIELQRDPYFLLVLDDITQFQSMQNEMARHERLESLGLLAGGIAHDFNNILAIILGYLSLAKNYTNPKEAIYSKIIEAEKASRQAIGLTKQLLTFSSGGAPVKKAASIEELIEETVLFAMHGASSCCEFNFTDHLMPAEIDRDQICQVINNLIINALQAMPQGGLIRVFAENVTVDQASGLPLKAGLYVKISVQDSGQGIAEAVIKNIFDPYFTTKSTGTGLGLTTSYSIVRQHDGHMTVDSQIGVGTTFAVYLPASNAAVENKEHISHDVKTGKGKILVMDDENGIRRLAGEMLNVLGYESYFAKDGLEAIELYKHEYDLGKPFDVVILDLTVRGSMGGKETIQRLIKIDPAVQAIVSSGYSEDAILAKYAMFGFKGAVAKPYQLEELADVLASVISEKVKS
ncbi:MAG: PAS domain S-box protein [Bacillota bacterium]|nr:PAS domain S-box protein [Bacillota bacterium]